MYLGFVANLILYQVELLEDLQNCCCSVVLWNAILNNVSHRTFAQILIHISLKHPQRVLRFMSLYFKGSYGT